MDPQNYCLGSSLVVQWLRLYAFNAGCLDLIPYQGIGAHISQGISRLLQLRPGKTKLKKKILIKKK